MRRPGAVLLVWIVLSVGRLAAQTVEEKWKQGHSRHGDAFDVGPREKPWAMEGIGRAHFPITTSNSEVQRSWRS